MSIKSLSRGILANPWQVYTLSDPRDKSVRYVGMTSHVPTRLSGHASTWRHPKHPVQHWIKELHDAGLRPVIEVIAGTDRYPDAYVLEAYWIEWFLDQGTQLTNVSWRGSKRYYDYHKQLTNVSEKSSDRAGFFEK